MAVKLKCPVCEKKFIWDTKLAWPDRCPFKDCRAVMGNDRDDDDIVMPFIKSSSSAARHQASDDMYRQMEAGSEQRAAMAAAQLGVPVSDMADLKITNLKDARNPGEVAAVAPQNEVSKFIAQNPNASGFRGADGLAYSGAVQTGVAPNAGARMRTTLQQHHAELSHGVAVSDRPALETLQPGYRRRG